MRTIAALQLHARDAASSGSYSADPDSDVLELVDNGDIRTAVRRLMDRHGNRVYRYCRAALRDATLADDVHQQIFIAVFRDLVSFRRRSTVRTWLFMIARNRVIDAGRARCRARTFTKDDEMDDVPDLRPLPEAAIADMQLHEALSASLAELDERVRLALLLHYQQGFTFEEMAEICHEKPGTLAARVARALPRLRAIIEARIRGSR
jgi:RNA polymerase sigma-70 factor, ECF subfamily